ncbi:MAG: 4-(cytidine 5'-diphospho)-2-C-methyl-D-erythritol kinase [Acidaminococcales bacterium]|nr:4-(cytidine 5'-diphospho)-2-C-methyl-D-erythritol kinase [Acidaminococcales bacterium]
MPFLTVTENARAKINLTLDVLGKRPDGYHEIKTIMQSLALSDSVEIGETEGLLSVCVEGADLPDGEGNIAFRAARLAAVDAKREPALAIKIVKRIPVAAGLAGGSSDAAAVLRGINRLWNLRWEKERLEQLAARLGSDVPFCLCGGSALASGRGEVVEPLPDCPDFTVVLACPDFAVATSAVYANYVPARAGRRPDTESAVRALTLGDRELLAGQLCNVLESVTFRMFPEVERLKRTLLDAGAAGVMSGSGPAVFALAPDEKTAATAAAAVKDKTKARVWVTKTKGRERI